jgi:hypothetical protein
MLQRLIIERGITGSLYVPAEGVEDWNLQVARGAIETVCLREDRRRFGPTRTRRHDERKQHDDRTGK